MTGARLIAPDGTVIATTNPDVKSAFDAASASKRYESVLHWNGQTVRPYALTNPMEFFAEASEAYFGQNDFYPFVRPELKQHDPGGYAMIEKAWGVVRTGKGI